MHLLGFALGIILIASVFSITSFLIKALFAIIGIGILIAVIPVIIAAVLPVIIFFAIIVFILKIIF